MNEPVNSLTSWTAAQAYLKGLKDAEDEQTDALETQQIASDARIADLIAQNNAVIDRLRASHDRLLAAAKHVIAQADRDTYRLEDGTPHRSTDCQQSYELLCAAIAAAEEQAL